MALFCIDNAEHQNDLIKVISLCHFSTTNGQVEKPALNRRKAQQADWHMRTGAHNMLRCNQSSTLSLALTAHNRVDYSIVYNKKERITFVFLTADTTTKRNFAFLLCHPLVSRR